MSFEARDEAELAALGGAEELDDVAEDDNSYHNPRTRNSKGEEKLRSSVDGDGGCDGRHTGYAAAGSEEDFRKSSQTRTGCNCFGCTLQ